MIFLFDIFSSEKIDAIFNFTTFSAAIRQSLSLQLFDRLSIVPNRGRRR
jgi:hypothetical protein